jgi:hypothetical protein
MVLSRQEMVIFYAVVSDAAASVAAPVGLVFAIVREIRPRCTRPGAALRIV